MSVVAQAGTRGSPQRDPGAVRPRCATLEDLPGGHSADRIMRISARQLLCALLGLAVVVSLTACEDTPIEAPYASVNEPAREPTSAPHLASGSTADGTTAAGIGGAYTMTAGGDRITGLSLVPTGIEVPAGLPVRVRVSGAITRTATEGLKAFCALPKWQASCEGVWTDIVAEDPIPPSGLAAVGGRGAALIAWDGDGAVSPPDGSRIALTGPAGTELWAGRISWECYYFDSYLNQGSCFTFGGGYTVTVEADDGGTPNDTANAEGSGGGSNDAELTASAVLTGGGGLHLSAIATDGSRVESPKWSFVPDSFKTAQGDTTATPVAAPPPDGAAPSRPGLSGGRVPAGVEQLALNRWRLPDGRVVGPGLYVVRASPDVRSARTPPPVSGPDRSPPARPAWSAPAAAPVEVDDCLDLADCETSAPAQSGTYVVLATVNGQLLSASARVGQGPSRHLSLLCPTSVARAGQAAICVASASDIHAAVAISAWHFDPDSSGLTRVDRSVDVTDLSWAGRMATSGTVVVDGTVDGTPGSARAHINVTARDWSQVFPAFSTNEIDPGSLPEVPDSLGDLGHIGFHPSTLGTSVKEIMGGPNRGLNYLSAPPYAIEARINVNTVALAVKSRFWFNQPPQRYVRPDGTEGCARRDVVPFIPVIRRHEGVGLFPGSHARFFQDTLFAETGLSLEAVVGNSGWSVLNVANSRFRAVMSAAQRESAKADSKAYRPSYCFFLY